MIRLTRIFLEGQLNDRLAVRTGRLIDRNATSVSARRSWRSAAHERTGIKDALLKIAVGIERCMYCGDSRGTDIDHFQPIKIAPLRTFDWTNHFLACSSCNSNAKRGAYPCDESGQSLLVDPTVEEPSDHLRLTLNDGRYAAMTCKGRKTIEVFQLNRADLRLGRENAFRRCKSMLRDYLALIGLGHSQEAKETRDALENQPFADVLHAMYKIVELPDAAIIIGGNELAMLLRSWKEERAETAFRPEESAEAR